MVTTSNMGLTAWDLASDPYDHSQLASNFGAIDTHNHTSGKGVVIPTEGIANSAITGAKIAGDAVNPLVHIPANSIPASRLGTDSVGNDELADNSVGAANIIAGAITLDKLDPNIMPIGMVILWYRASASVSPPTGWEVMDGRAWSGITNKMGAGAVQLNTGNIPNMINKFPLGAGLSGTGTGPTTPPDIGGQGGQHTRDLSHTHTAQSHSHTVGAHVHGIADDGAHNHLFNITTVSGPSTASLFSRDVGVPKAEGRRQALYLPGHNADSFVGSDAPAPMSVVAAHNHGSATASATATTDSVTSTINSWSGADLDFRPGYVGLLFLMKVR